MNQAAPILEKGSRDAGLDQIVKLAVMAVGGQGGGVLNGWIVRLAERNGYVAQATSVAGVAQRTGATIYYVEMMPDTGRQPVFALAPAEGDVDILIAAEMMEAGRAIMRGFVTPDRTLLIASTHRALAVSEKIVPGSGIADAAEVRRAAEKAARDFIAFDMDRMAEEAGTVISAALFGALAGSGALPFEVESYRETIRESGRGVEASLRAFETAREAAEARRQETEPARAPKPPEAQVTGPKALVAEWQRLVERAAALPGEEAQRLARAGLKKVVDYQDLAYGAAYMDRVEAAAARDARAGGAAHAHAFTANAAKYLANAMCYDDIIRVADLKTRAPRAARIDKEMRKGDEHLIRVTEYVHPGAAEVVSLMPAGLGRWIEARPKVWRGIDRVVNHGRRIRSDRVAGFLMFYTLGGLRRWRRRLLRHQVEEAHWTEWLEAAEARLPRDYALAVETLKARRLIKGYSDTHKRGLNKYDKVMSGIALVEGREDAADWANRLIQAALKDPEGKALEDALQTVRSFTTAGAA
ncbi:indolepyruvate oxidoreductase subunit beta family protein [Rhodosalinus sp.]|uniref:indolepyruvate oxidoreductase subunit beta family protein n=1 Tax=Rhodosalinus sp. TaxID=2047741 RepID=UPI00397BBB7F